MKTKTTLNIRTGIKAGIVICQDIDGGPNTATNPNP